MRVLMSPGPAISNPFVSLLIRNLDPDIEVTSFTWREAFLGRHEVLHVHWPDALLRAPSPARRGLKLAQFYALLLWNRMRGVRQVWTVHNTTPHEAGGSLHTKALKAWERTCTDRVFLSRAAIAAVPDTSSTVIKHGDYSAIRDEHLERAVEATSGELLVFGLLRPYKGVETLIDAVTAQRQLNLRVIGRSDPADYGETLGRLIGNSDRIELALGRIDDGDLVEAITHAEFVILPYQKIYNSGAAIMALTLGRPIIATDSSTMRELRDEVGDEWVYCLPGTLTTEALQEAVNTLRQESRDPLPRFEGRDWADIGHQYSDLYRGSSAPIV